MTSPLRWARRTVVAVFLLGLVVVVGPAVWNADSLFRDPFIGAEERKTVETFGADGRLTGREVTTSPSGGSLVERSLAAGGVLLLRLAVVSAAAYLAGALVFRTMSGTFPSEIGGVKFAEDAAVGLEKAEANIEVVRDRGGRAHRPHGRCRRRPPGHALGGGRRLGRLPSGQGESGGRR